MSDERGGLDSAFDTPAAVMENYFNYFTEIEEYFWKKRGTAMLVSTLDWALINSWKEAKIPIEAVLKGIDRTFEKYEARRHRVRHVNSLAYCQQEILAAAGEQERAVPQHPSTPELFHWEELAGFFEKNAEALEKSAGQFELAGRAESAATFRALAASLRELAAGARSGAPVNLEETERRVTALEDKMVATLMQAALETDLISIREEMDRGLAPVRSTMGVEQIVLLEKQFLQRKLLENAKLPRLSLFYL